MNTQSSSVKGLLYVVATPIGHLEDISHRALQVLQSVDLIAAEDTRCCQKLLQRWHIKQTMVSFHEHNAGLKIQGLLDRLLNGQTIALVTDAGTPLIQDPGYELVCAAHEHAIPVCPIPGACAAIAALQAAGLPTDRFLFVGFLPAKLSARRRCLQDLQYEQATLIVYESPHRLLKTLKDMVEIFGPDRMAAFAKELTKTYEHIQKGSLEFLYHMLENKTVIKGEYVLLIQGSPIKCPPIEQEELILRELMHELPFKRALALTQKITQKPRNRLYNLGLEIRKQHKDVLDE